MADDLRDPSLYLNRELSWLEFNRRVLHAAADPSVPLLERLKFLAISGTNLDEFFMVRVAGLKQQVAGRVDEGAGADGMTPAAQLREIARRAHEMVALQYRTLRDDLIPGLRAAGIQLLRPASFDETDRVGMRTFFEDQIFPVLTPLAVDPGHPFPTLRNRSLNLVVRFRRGKRRSASLGVVQVPSVLDRLVALPGHAGSLAWLEDVIALHVDTLFPGTQIMACHPFRVTRNSDLQYDEDEAEDLLKLIEKEVRRRDRGSAVRLEVDEDADATLVNELSDALRVSEEDVYRIRGPLDLGDLMDVYVLHEGTSGGTRMKDEPYVAATPVALRGSDHPILPAIGRRDFLLHHPYDSFDPVVAFVEEAAADPDVLAIKQTLYRTSGDSPIVKALARAAENRKQVTAIVELKARFDEENNIAWARKLEEAGVHVVYGLLGLKTHCKMSLVVRREPSGIRRYLHLSTGNYNPSTARVYTDLSLFTCDPAFGRDASALFNLLTGNATAGTWERFAVAPMDLHQRTLALIASVEQAAHDGKPARIRAKMNSLVDGDVIRALYRASRAGATIDLLVRGICCLRPGVPGLSENIRVRGIVDRFLEHSRILHVIAGDDEQLFLSSADWMPRNFQRRVEVMFPVLDPALRTRIVDEILATLSAPDARAWELAADGSYIPVPPEPAEGGSFRPQQRFVELAMAAVRGADRTARPAPPVALAAGFGPEPARLTKG